MGTHPIFETDFDCLTESDFQNDQSAEITDVTRRDVDTFDSCDAKTPPLVSLRIRPSKNTWSETWSMPRLWEIWLRLQSTPTMLSQSCTSSSTTACLRLSITDTFVTDPAKPEKSEFPHQNSDVPLLSPTRELPVPPLNKLYVK